MKELTLGVLGGVGPLATVYFTDMVVKMTEAEKDQDHISMIVFNHATIPDRTAYILDDTQENPLPVMIDDAKRLEKAGADFIVIPCNTAHYFYDEIRKNITVPMLNIIEETVLYALEKVPQLKTLGILATEGTVSSGSYEHVCRKYGLTCIYPDKEDQKQLMEIIYRQVKAGEPVDFAGFMRIIENLKGSGCQAVVLGCTELSVIHRDHAVCRNDIIDSLQVLARAGILRCGKRLKHELKQEREN